MSSDRREPDDDDDDEDSDSWPGEELTWRLANT